ncbi:hypothetical protein [Stenotrophomonas sp. YAU14D1_LEIMI4_1]|uniref:hypothetical protein n=1 Tax=Stenotrophomonas sp. YAU14D1_LEIMI4_1 TaxID=2072407 RepID=UPI00131F3E40|nr:hypothetical protein [Stenotrophomonas sp. YAU14D1_LEIMI4_1]
MRPSKRLICGLAVVLGLVTTAWAVGSVSAAEPEPEPAVADAMIEVTGTLEVHPGGHGLGEIRVDDGRCFDLALPKHVLKDSLRWLGKRVVIAGSMQFRPRMDEVIWWEIKDRKIEGFGCSEDVIYVERIERL